MQKLPSVFVWCGLLFLIVSVIVGWIAGPLLIQDQITRMANLKNGTYSWDKWQTPTNEAFLKVYLFNVTNPETVEQGGIPIFQELGPYTYQETRFKENIEFHPEKDTVSYTQPVSYHFREDLSVGNLSDVLTVINIPLVGVSQKLSGYSSWIRYLMGVFLEQYEESLFIQRTAEEMIFKGYYNAMVEELQHLTGENFFPDAIVGLLTGRNNSDEGIYEVYTGKTDYTKLGEVHSYNGNTHLPAWPAEPCNMINGSEGSILPPLITKKTILRGFHHDVCRSFYTVYTGDMEYKNIPGYTFEPPEEQYFSPRKNPDNKCFCIDPNEDYSNCYEDGVYSGAGCHRDGPLTISLPHFLFAPYYLNLTEGLKPDKEKHGIRINIEPNSGLILNATRRMQMNVDLKPNGAVGGMKNVPTMQFPVIWVDESFSLDKDVHSYLLSSLLIAVTVLEVGRWIFLISSLVLVVAAISINIMRARKKPYIYS